MFKGTFKKANILKKIATILNNIFHSISMQIAGSLLRIIMVSPCKTMLLNIAIDFDECDAPEETIAFSVNAKHFLESFNTLRANDSVLFQIDNDRLTIEIQSEECVESILLWITRTQTLQVTNEPEYGDPIRVKDLNFQKLCKALNNASNELMMRGNERRISLRANLENMYGRELQFGDRNATVDDFEDVYSTEDFLKISKISTLSDNLNFYARANEPLCIEARFGERRVFKVLIKSKTLMEGEES